MFYGALWGRLPFALANFTEMSHEGRVVFYTNALGDISLSYVALRRRQLFFNRGWDAA